MTNVTIEPTTVRGDRGTRYRVYYEGAVLIEETWNPELDACRLLAARRITGRLEVWRTGKPQRGSDRGAGVAIPGWRCLDGWRGRSRA